MGEKIKNKFFFFIPGLRAILFGKKTKKKKNTSNLTGIRQSNKIEKKI